MHTITLIPGDGTGPELVEAAKRVIEATGISVEWDVKDAGVDAEKKCGNPLPEETLDSIRKNKVALKGPITTPLGSGFRSVNVALRHSLNLYACVRPCKFYPGVKTRISAPENINLTIIRENTEDLYAGVEFQDEKIVEFLNQHSQKKISPHSALSIKPISEKASEKIARFAFDYATKNKRKSVTAITKSNIMKFTDGLFMKTAERVSKDYKIPYQHVLVDNMCMQLVQKPELYDVLLLPNLYGDIISDLCAGLIGGLGIAPGANIGDGIAVFEATHGSAPKYKGMNKVNPTALILSGVMMLHHIEEHAAAVRLESAVAKVIEEGKFVTYDINPHNPLGTKEMADAVIRQLH